MSQKDVEVASIEKLREDSSFCNPGYIASLPGLLRILNIIVGCIVLGFWIPGYEHDYTSPSLIINFRDFQKHYGAGYKTETLNQFALADVIISLLISIALLIGLVVVPHSFVDWNRMNKIAHAFLALFYGIGAICGCVGVWYFQENCCRVDLEWNGVGFRYKPAVREFGYPRQNGHCNCWLTKRLSEMEGDTMYNTAIWEPHNYPDKYSGEENTFVSFAAHHIHLHTAAAVLMIVNTGIYALASLFTKPSSAKSA